MENFGKLIRLDPRKIWANEAKNFTPWLSENISELGEVLGMELELYSTEGAVGDFSSDIVAKDLGTNSYVIIENQLSHTDHDHLGKLLTYAGGYDASSVVWLATSFREEHRQTLDWLNQSTGENCNFFGVIVEVFQIDDSKPTFNFRPVVFPNEWSKTSKKRGSSKEITPKAEAYRVFFQDLIDILRGKYRFTNARKGQPQSWYAFASGMSGITYNASFSQDKKVRTEVGIDRGEADLNKATFDRLYLKKDEIEKKIGYKLEWDRLDEKQSCRIAVYNDGSIDEEIKHNEIKEWFVKRLLEFDKVIGPYLRNL